jgi:ABC-type phosphate/phosphonate transport system substrate-binding protein
MIIASLPMYDWPEIHEATDEFWRGFLEHAGITGALNRATAHSALWRNPNLTFSQTCGYPFTHEFKGLLNYIATPHYAAVGCEGAQYCSMIFARENSPLEGFAGSIAAINSKDSMSGMLALKLVFAEFARGEKFFSRVIISGSHIESLIAVQEGRADICAIDAVCVALAKRYRPQILEGLVEVARSPKVPGLPYVTRHGDPDKLAAALQKTFADPGLAHCREALLLSGISVLNPADYDQITSLESKLPKFEL